MAWPNYYISLVNIILDNKALYVYKHKHECDVKLKSTQLFLKKISCLFRQKTNALHIKKLYKNIKHVEGSDL